MKPFGHCVKRSRATARASPPRHPHDTAPKGAGTRPGDGRLSIGNSIASLQTCSLSYIPRSAFAICPPLKDGEKDHDAGVFDGLDSIEPRVRQLSDELVRPGRACRCVLIMQIRYQCFRSIALQATSGLTAQKLESSFGKYGLSYREVNLSIDRSSFCKQFHSSNEHGDRKSNQC